MSRYHAKGQQTHGDLLVGLAQDLDEGGIVTGLLEEGGTTHGPVEDVVDIPSQRCPQASWHPRRLPGKPRRVK